MTDKEYDLIVIGAGTAGCLAAFAAAKKGLSNIALIDRKTKDQIGRKICGDGIGTKHIEFLEEKGFPLKEEGAINNLIKTAHIVSPDKKTDIKMPTQEKLTIINRHKFGQVLLKETINAGVELFDDSTFKEFSQEKNKAVITINKSNNETIKLTAPLAIDASGINSKIREDLSLFGDNSQLKDDEQYYCYREICRITDLPEYYIDSTIFEFTSEITKGGYMWFFGRANNELNMGTGIPKSWIKDFSPKEVYEKYMLNRFKKYKVLDFGGGFVSTRRPIPSLVNDNVMLIGDAGCIVNPLHGGGLSASLNSGYIAGTIAADLIPNHAIKREDLWIFNKKIMEQYGKRYSLLDLYRILLQNIPDEELNQAFEQEFLPLGLIFYAREYDLLLSLSKQLSELWIQLNNNRFNLLPKAIEQVHQLTKEYPTTPFDIEKWTEKYNSIFETYQNKIAIRKM